MKLLTPGISSLLTYLWHASVTTGSDIAAVEGRGDTVTFDIVVREAIIWLQYSK